MAVVVAGALGGRRNPAFTEGLGAKNDVFCATFFLLILARREYYPHLRDERTKAQNCCVFARSAGQVAEVGFKV